MTDLTKIELVQHSMKSIRSYLDDILQIQHQIEDLKARSKELAFRAGDESRIISFYFKDEEFKQSLCDDLVEKVRRLQDRVSNLKSLKELNSGERIMESTTKLWKVVVEISHARSDGNGESCRETKTRYFDVFSEAEYFADRGDIGPNNFFACVVSRQIYEYDIRSVRQLEHKKHEVVTEVTETEWVWE